LEEVAAFFEVSTYDEFLMRRRYVVASFSKILVTTKKEKKKKKKKNKNKRTRTRSVREEKREKEREKREGRLDKDDDEDSSRRCSPFLFILFVESGAR
jgi:hypothetical protein